MNYPGFDEIVENTPVILAKNVFKRFPKSAQSTFVMSEMNNYCDEVFNVSKNPVIGGMVLGKANGRYQTDKSVIGVSLVELSGQNYIAPFYASSTMRKSFIDCEMAFSTDLENFEQICTGENMKLLLEIRDSDLVSKMFIKSGFNFISTYIGYEIFGGLLGVSDFIEENLKIPKPAQNIGLAAIVTAYADFKNYKSERDAYYGSFIKNIIDYKNK